MTIQVENDITLVRLAEALRAHDRANRVVGMPTPNTFFIKQAAEQLGPKEEDYDVKRVRGDDGLMDT